LRDDYDNLAKEFDEVKRQKSSLEEQLNDEKSKGTKLRN
jgi:hypothetical protein